MTPKKFKEIHQELIFLREDIKEDFNGSPDYKKTTIAYNLIFYKITEDDTLLSIYNFITTNELRFTITPHQFADGKPGIKIRMR